MSKFRIKASSLNIRKEPGKEFAKIGSVLKGEIVEPTETSPDGKWSKIKKDGIVGWVSNDFLEPVTESITAVSGNMKEIADFFIKKLLTNPKYNSASIANGNDLLYGKFVDIWEKCVVDYRKKYPAQNLTFTETYRSNVLQKKYFDQGASKIKKDGMHHYGIAGDTIFIIGGKRTYNGDVSLIRKIYKDHGLTILGTWDPLHVQFIPVKEQQALRNAVREKLIQFQRQHDLAQTGLDDTATIAKAREIFT